MADIVQQRDLVDITKGALASAFTALTAGGTGDNTAVTGLTIDRQACGMPQNAVFSLAYQATLAAGQTLSIKSVGLEHSADGSTWVAYTPPGGVPASPGAVATGQTGGSTERGVARVAAILSGANRYVRLNWTPDLSAAGTDTATVAAIATMAGFDRL